MRIEILSELTARLAEPYKIALQNMLEQSVEAAEQCNRGNVMTAFRLLREDPTVQVPEGWGLYKEGVLDAAWLTLPSTYQAGDIDPD